mmetsp:Transcript_25394/g.45897  ORF Transcript_25394/g.45897 Transcript_25394/m.45897 type:complete len:88 (+) Transcript_25394:888-1151(+)
MAITSSGLFQKDVGSNSTVIVSLFVSCFQECMSPQFLGGPPILTASAWIRTMPPNPTLPAYARLELETIQNQSTQWLIWWKVNQWNQ